MNVNRDDKMNGIFGKKNLFPEQQRVKGHVTHIDIVLISRTSVP